MNLIGCMLLILAFQGPRDTRIHQGAGFKILKTENLQIYYTGDFINHVELLARDGEAFLKKIEREWRVILPEEPIKVSLFRVAGNRNEIQYLHAPKWLTSTYWHENEMIYLRVQPPQLFDRYTVSRALKHHLVHRLLRRGAWNAPSYMQMGIARFFVPEQPSRQLFNAVFAFQREESVSALLAALDSPRSQRDFDHGAALAEELVRYMSEIQPEGLVVLIQELLRGRELEPSLLKAGFPSESRLVDQFTRIRGPEFKLTRVLKTYDFWISLAGFLAILAMLYKVIAAYRVSGMSFLEIDEPLPDLDPGLFQGPAFGVGMQPAPVPAPVPVPGMATEIAPAESPMVDRPRPRRRSSSRPAARQMADPAPRSGTAEPPQRRGPVSPARRRRQLADIEAEVDELFSGFPASKPEAAPKPTKTERRAESNSGLTPEPETTPSLDADLDAFFEGFGGKDKNA